MKLIENTFMKLLVSILIISVIIGCESEPEPQGKSIKILLDVSSSSPLWSPAFAAKAAGFVANRVSQLPYLSEVEILNFGSFHNKNPDDMKFQVNAKSGHKPDEVAASVSTLIVNIAQWAGKEPGTALIGKLEKVAPALRGGESLIIVSDFIEETYAFDFFQNSGALPARPGLLNGVEVIGVGFGWGLRTEAQYGRLKTLWSDWIKTAGVSDVRLFSDVF